MRVEWDKPQSGARERIPQVLNVDPGKPLVCVFLGDHDSSHVVYTHYLPHERRSVPCEGDNCPHCPREANWKGVLPVLQCTRSLAWIDSKWDLSTMPTEYSNRSFRRWALQVTITAELLLDKAEPGRVFQIGRMWDAKNAHLFHKIEDKKVTGIEGLNFDPRPSMHRAWRGRIRPSDTVHHSNCSPSRRRKQRSDDG